MPELEEELRNLLGLRFPNAKAAAVRRHVHSSWERPQESNLFECVLLDAFVREWEPDRPSAEPQEFFFDDSELVVTKEEIRGAYDEIDDPGDAIREIAKIWAKLDDATGLAEARTRILLGKVDPPEELPELPAWVRREFASLKKEEEQDRETIPASPIAIECAKRLISSSLAKVGQGESLTAEIYHGPGGRVVVDWDVGPNRLQWMVGVPDLPWPGVAVNMLTRTGSGASAARSTETLHDAFAVLDRFKELTERSDGE